jgi:hypothetical protein
MREEMRRRHSPRHRSEPCTENGRQASAGLNRCERTFEVLNAEQRRTLQCVVVAKQAGRLLLDVIPQKVALDDCRRHDQDRPDSLNEVKGNARGCDRLVGYVDESFVEAPLYSAIVSPEPPKSTGKSLSFGRPSFMGSTVDS